MEGGDFMSNDFCYSRIIRVLQYVYNRNKLLAYDMIVMINHIERTNFIIQDGIVRNTDVLFI